jgi:hypothetical protein
MHHQEDGDGNPQQDWQGRRKTLKQEPEQARPPDRRDTLMDYLTYMS